MTSAPSPSLVQGYACCFAAFIIYASSASILAAHQGTGYHGTLLTLGLAGTEILAAAAFMIRPLRLVGATVLMLVFAIAGALTAAAGQVPANLIFYAVTTTFIVLFERQTVPDPAVS